MLRNYLVGLSCLMVVSLALRADADAAQEGGIRLGDEQVQRWRVGVVVHAVGGPCRNLFATVPVPQDWPEQDVEIVQEDISDSVRRVSYRSVDEGIKQMLVQIPAINSGNSARAVVTFEIRRRAIKEPVDSTIFRKPKKVGRQLKKYLGTSPYIETRHPKVRSLASETTKDKESDWEKVEAIYDYVRDNIEYREGKIKTAVDALRDGYGDCEEMTSLFVAMCRASKIPARMVWVPDHCYPEFYLEDEDGDGHWIPCQAAGTRAFGSMPEMRPILQKGDNFRVPEKRPPQRYVAEFLKGSGRGGGKPKVSFIREYAAPAQ